MDDIKNDPRFSHIASDPKFRLMPKSKRKVKIDSRFQSLFSSQHFSHKTDIDKRGRPVLNTTSNNKHVMHRFYDLSDQDESDPEAASLSIKKQKVKKQKTTAGRPGDIQQKAKRPTEVSPDRSTDKTGNDTHGDKKVKSFILQEDDSCGSDNLVGEDGSIQGTDDDSGDDDELPEFTQEHLIDETEVDHKWNELHEDAPPVVESTSRLAVCNMEWDFVKAQDLFVLFKSFVPAGGSVTSVIIFPSEFGKERMAEEARLGPREMREQLGTDHMTSPGADGGSRKKRKTNNQPQTKRSTKEQEATDTEKLREYQLNRLRYYFAVVVCDSVQTAETIYNECDGREYLLSSVRLDLRFIPEGMAFDDDPKDSFSEHQSVLEYEPNKFSASALCQAKVDVTWDETDFDRLSRRVAGLQQKELESIVEENKYADIIAPPESEDDEGLHDHHALDIDDGEKVLTEEEKTAVYRRLLEDVLKDDDDDVGERGKDDKEFVWQPGLKSSAVKKIKKKEKMEEDTGVVSDYLEKKREKRRKKREEKMKEKTEIDEERALNVDGGDNVLQRVLAGHREQRGEKKKRRLVVDQHARTDVQAGLELLIMDENNKKKEETTNVGESKKLRKKSKKKKMSESKDDYQLDVDDPRFAALYTSHHFHIDPSVSHFRKTKNMSTLVDEQIYRRSKLGPGQGHQTDSSRSLSQTLIQSLKSKMKK